MEKGYKKFHKTNVFPFLLKPSLIQNNKKISCQWGAAPPPLINTNIHFDTLENKQYNLSTNHDPPPYGECIAKTREFGSFNAERCCYTPLIK